MPTTSTFPADLDNDANLYRVLATDVLIPEQLNNKTDAIEAIEATIGVAGGGTFNTGLAHFDQFPGVAIQNPRYPWSPANAKAWYTVNGAPPSGWTLNDGTLVYNAPAPYAKFSLPASTGAHVAVLTITRPFYLITRLMLRPTASTEYPLCIGTQVLGTPFVAPLGVAIRRDAAGNYVVQGTEGGTTYGGSYTLHSHPWLFVMTIHTAGSTEARVSVDGTFWVNAVYQHTQNLTPTIFAIGTPPFGSPAGQPLWIDFVACGASAATGMGTW